MWFVLFGGKYIPYTDASALMYDICNVYTADVEFVWHNCSSLCGYFDCEEVAFCYKECYSNLVHADREVVERNAASLDYLYYAMQTASPREEEKDQTQIISEREEKYFIYGICTCKEGVLCERCERLAEAASGCC